MKHYIKNEQINKNELNKMEYVTSCPKTKNIN